MDTTTITPPDPVDSPEAWAKWMLDNFLAIVVHEAGRTALLEEREKLFDLLRNSREGRENKKLVRSARVREIDRLLLEDSP